MTYKKTILKLTPEFIHKFLRDLFFLINMIPNYAYDARRFLVYSGLNKSHGYKAERAARITLFYHQVEKGLSLLEPRLGFGMAIIPRLFDDIEAYIDRFGLEEPAMTALAALNAYVSFHEARGHAVEHVENRLKQLTSKFYIHESDISEWHGGTLLISSDQLKLMKSQGFRSFFESRHSIRQFSGGIIPLHDIRQAIEISQKTPSVCNRQSWKVHLYTNPEKMSRMLAIQAGSRGFGEKASVLLAITCELGSFVDVGERYQAWIDGGMFSMAICLALHELGYGSCCLNWSKTWSVDKELRLVADIPVSEQIIMLVAVGTLPSVFSVARSYRPSVDHCLVIH